MRKIIFLLCVIAFLVLSACGKQNADQIVGQGSSVPEQSAAAAQNGGFKEFKITAKQFEFTPSTIEVNKGDKVRLIVTSIDVPHGIAIKEYNINEQLPVGKPVTIEFTADKQGSFVAYCSVLCGSGHSNMKGKLIVK